jgi:predicted lipid-binding transport protein (Tim44 family)
MTADPERRLSEALRAQARGGGRPSTPVRREPARPTAMSVRTALVIALLGGAVLGMGLALLSLLTPGLLPALG